MLTPVVLDGLGYRCEWAEQRDAELLAIGSIIQHATARHTVWGSGAIRATDRLSADATYLAVRGPLTRNMVLEAGGTCQEVYGDPALLLPRFHCEPVRQTHRLGIVPHYVDEAQVRKHYPDTPIISPLRHDPLEVVDEIRSCRKIVSSSLHGLVVAHAYGIPAAWVEFSDRLGEPVLPGQLEREDDQFLLPR